MPSRATLLFPLLVLGCAAPSPRFPLEEPLQVDADTTPWQAPCTTKDGTTTCIPATYDSPFAWDGFDAMIFRPVERFLAVDPAGESVDVNALDEVPDSSWFSNRLGRRSMSPDDVARGACDDTLDPDEPDGTWTIDEGKANGANPGFRIKTEHGIYLLKADEKEQPERATGATAIAARIYHAVGYWTDCDRVVYVPRSLLKLKPGLTYKDNGGVSRPFGETELAHVLDDASRRGDRYRLVASRWLDGKTIGPFRYTSIRKDDPNDVVVHEDRRELRGQRVLAAWLGHFDSREQNSMNTWISATPTAPGYIRHWLIDFNDCFGSEWSWVDVSKRLNHAYYFDGGQVAADFLSLGAVPRAWDGNHRSSKGFVFGFYASEPFVPDDWKPGYQNPAFLRASERDEAWMARILARLGPEHIEKLVAVGDFTNPQHRDYLTRVLVERQRKILQRYLAIASPVADLAVEDDSICATDLSRRVLSGQRYRATVNGNPVAVVNHEERVCLPLPRIGQGPDDDRSRYLVVALENGASKRPLTAHLYATSHGFRLVGIER